MPTVVGASNAGGWQDTTSITVPSGVQEGDLLRTWISANDTPGIEVPEGWDLEVSDVGEDLGGNTAVYSYIRTATSADESAPTYTWTWPGGEHWRFAIMVAISDAEGVRSYDLNADPNTTTLDSAPLQAQAGDLLLVSGYNRHETEKTWSPEGLTEIANLERGLISAYQVAEDGPVPVYTLTAGEAGTMAVLTALISAPEEDEQDPPVWANNFNGAHGTAITVENSGDHGDELASVSPPAFYQNQSYYRGTGAAYVGSTRTRGNIAIPIGAEQNEPYAVRFYFNLITNASLVVANNPDEMFGTVLCELYGNTGSSPTSRILVNIVDDDVPNFRNRWVRFEYVRQGPDGNSMVRLWWTNPHDDAPGSHDLEAVSTGVGAAIEALYLRGADPGHTDPETGPIQYGIYLDEIAAVTGSGEFLGPVPDQVVEPTWQNSFDGPDGQTVTVANSANYGDALSFVGSNITYSESWFVPHTGGGQASLHVQGTFEPPEPGDTDWTLRWYARVDHRLQVAGSADLVDIDKSFGTFEVLDQDFTEYLDEVTDKTIRCEIACRSGALTARIWWNDPSSLEEPDLHITDSNAGFGANDYISFFGQVTDGDVYVDEMAMAYEAGIIGPVVYNRVETSVSFNASASGVVGGRANAVANVEFSADTYGFRSDTGAAVGAASFDGYADGEGFIPTRAEGNVDFDGEATGGPLYTGDSEDTVYFEPETSATKSTSGEALEGEVVYSPVAAGRARTHLPDVPLVGMQYRLIAYDPDGERRGQLPWPLSFQLGVPLNDTPSLALEYLKDAPGAGLLNSLCEVAVEFALPDSPTFTEPPGCRFLNLRHQEDPADRMGVVRYTMPSYAWMLRKVRNLNRNAFNEEGQRDFSSATPGRIVHTFLTEAQGRGNVPGLVWDFTATHDSAGQAWESAYNITFDAGQDLWSIIEALSTQHALDWRIHRRTLQMYNPDTAMNRDRADQAILHLHRDVTEAPNDRSGEELASRIFVQGDNAHVEINNNSGMRPWGAWEDYIAQNGVSDTGTLTSLAQWRLEATRGLRTQMTRGILFNTAKYLPFFSYQVGDYISAPGWFSQQDPLRVRQITITSTDPHSLEGNLVLNDRFIERQLRNDRKINALTGGSPPGGGGGGGRPPGEDTRTPQAPQSLLLNSDAYIDPLGNPRAQITANWDEVTHATNNTEMEIRHYQVWLRRAVFGAPFQLHTETTHPDTVAHMSGRLEPDEVYEVRVRAVGRNERPGLWSETVAIRAERDATPPDQPSAPQLSTRLGVIRVGWDGFDFNGLPMPNDFDHLQVWMSDDPATEYELVDTLYRAGNSIIPNQPYGEERWFFFIALDLAGNESDPSSIGSIATEQLVPTDVTPGSIGYELLEEGAVRDEILADDAVMNRHIAAGQITGEKIRAYSLTADRIAVGNTRNLLTDPKFLNDDLNELRGELSTGVWSYEEASSGNSVSITIGEDNPPGSYEFRFVQSLEVDTHTDRRAGYSVSAEMGRIIFRCLLDVQINSGTALVVTQARFINRNDVIFSTSTSVTQQSFTSSTSGHEFISNTGAIIPDEAVAVLLCVAVSLSTAPSGTMVRIRNPFSAMSDGQVLIENGAISANKIAANAVTADKIEAGAIRAQHIQANAIDADRIQANAITAKHTIVGATIRTVATTNRGVVMNVNGIIAHDSVGNQTFTVSSSTGNVNIVGTLRTGWAGENRVEVSDSANYMNQPGVRLYSGGSGARDSSLFIADGQGTGGWDPYSVVLTGSEITRNSSGRTDLVIRHGGQGGAALRYQRSAWGVIGIDFSEYQINILGRNATGQGSTKSVIWGRGNRLNPSSGNPADGFSHYQRSIFTYGAPSSTDGRMVQATGHNNGTAARVLASVVVQNSGNCQILGSRWNGGSFRVQYYAMWVQGSMVF